MKPVKQTTSNTCFPACLASLLEIPVGIVPNYVHKHWPDQIASTQRWLSKIGKTLLYLPLKKGWQQRETFLHTNIAMRCIVGVRVKGTLEGHVMIGRINKRKLCITHDPAHYPYVPSEYTVDCVLFLVNSAK